MSTPTLKPTSEQIEAVALFREGSLIVNAYAGAAKTTTATMIARDQELRSKRGIYLAFNKSIATEAASKFPRSVQCKTTHGLAFGPMMRRFGERIDKMTGSINAHSVMIHAPIHSISVQTSKGAMTLRQLQAAALTLSCVARFCQSADVSIGPQHVPFDGALARFDAQGQRTVASVVVPWAQHLWKKMTDPADPLPIGHDGYLKVWALSRPAIRADYVMLDEAQDTNPAVLEVLASSGLKVAYVGDQYQQIYSWRGAINAMDRICVGNRSYLTQSFRFGDAVANVANLVLRPLGATLDLRGTSSIASRVVQLDPDPVKAGAVEVPTTVIARTNMDLLGEYVFQLNNRRRIHIVGGNIELRRLLEDVVNLQMEQPASRPELFGFQTWNEVVDFAEDETNGAHALRTLVRMVTSFGAQALLDSLGRAEPTEETAEFVLSTAHKAKGREWNRVRLASDFRIASDDPGQLGLPEELRLFYVAATRAKQLLEIPASYIETLDAAVATAFNGVPETQS
ncbi:MAG: UvrD-helicase domain-containing protein [Casimicrobium sp.]